MFKLVPHCAKGSWVVSQSVGTTPVILGRKLATTYHLNDRYVVLKKGLGLRFSFFPNLMAWGYSNTAHTHCTTLHTLLLEVREREGEGIPH